jgi:predicted nucleic acid-binding protein
MLIFADSNILLRLIDRHDKQYPEIVSAVKKLNELGHQLVTAPQCIAEFWNVSTRPVENNGYARSVDEAERLVGILLQLAPVLPESESLFDVWLQLVIAKRVVGKQVHDARIAAFMISSNIQHIITCNGAHFGRFEPQISVLTPLKIWVDQDFRI